MVSLPHGKVIHGQVGARTRVVRLWRKLMEQRGKRRSHHMDDVSMMEEKRREWIRGEEGDLRSREGEDVGEGAIEGGEEEDLGFGGWLGA